MQVAKQEGACVIVAGIARDQKRLALARELGADIVVDASREDVVEIARGLTNGGGADLVYECAGSASSLNTCWEAVKKGGVLVPLGIHPGPIETDFNQITMKGLQVIGSYGYVWTSWQRSIRLLAGGKINTEALISHEQPLEPFEEAFMLAENGSATKVIFNPQMA
jgi:L-iditol 2-dehydrogenase